MSSLGQPRRPWLSVRFDPQPDLGCLCASGSRGARGSHAGSRRACCWAASPPATHRDRNCSASGRRSARDSAVACSCRS